MQKRFFFWILCVLVTMVALPAKASHIVGGEVTYVCLGNNHYKVSVTIYEDCLNGDPQAIAQDNPAYLSVFDGNNRLVAFDSVFYNAQDNILVPTNFNNACINNPPATCLRKKTFIKDYTLPPNGSGYQVVYQRCCRNASIVNIQNPSQVGATYFCTIPPASVALCNNSAVFKNYPPQIICINNPLVYDHSAYDPDGDSLSYEFCDTYSGGTDNDAKPIPPPPPYDTVDYVYPFSHSNPMSGYPQIQINPTTGLITGTPNLQGRFVVTVCCHEWRNGVMINTVTREFQFVVTNCSKAVVANIPQYSSEFNTYIVNCSNYTVKFVNTSTGGFSYFWDFGVPGATSTDFEPTYTYPDTGVYNVKLVVNRGTTCSDSITRVVKVYPTFKADYSYSGIQCPGSTLTFTDKTSSTYKPIVYWAWNFGDGATTQQENTTHAFSQGGLYNVTLTSRNDKGCEDTSLQQVLVEQFHPFAGDDTIIVKNESIAFNASGGIQYTWTPADNLNDPNIPNPIGTYPDTGHYAYNVHVVSPFGCEGNDSIVVWVVGQPAFFLPTAFTPNGDGLNDVFKPTAIGYRSLKYFRIYNRWGQIIFESHNLSDGWDGNIDGKKAEIGTYYWMLSTTDRAGKEQKMKGDVTLIR